MGRVNTVTFGVSSELLQECVDLIYQFDELGNPENLRAFATIKGLNLVSKCIPHSTDLHCDTFIYKLITTGRSEQERALFDLLDALAERYEDDFKGEQCRTLRAKINEELLQTGSQEEQAHDYQRLVDASIGADGSSVEKSANDWIVEVADDVHELALRFALAVFNGTTFEVIERATNDLSNLLQPLVPAPPVIDPTLVVPNVPLKRRLDRAGAIETAGEPPTWKRSVVIGNKSGEFSAEAIRCVWHEYRDTEWRQRFMQWFTSYAVGQPIEVRTRVAVAVGILGVHDYSYITENLLKRWIRESGEEHTDNRRAAEYRMAVGMALGVLARNQMLRGEIQSLVNKWSRSMKRTERWAAVRAYIFVGLFCQPISEVIDCWRRIAAAESVAVYEGADGIKTRRKAPIYMSLMDAMGRLFVNIAQLPAELSRSQFTGILKGLTKWISDKHIDSTLGILMFSTLANMTINRERASEFDNSPLLLSLIEEQSSVDDYRMQLAELFRTLLTDIETLYEGRDILCGWARWINGAASDSQSYEYRLQHLLKDIVLADQSGRMRGRLINCLRDCGRNKVLDRVILNL